MVLPDDGVTLRRDLTGATRISPSTIDRIFDNSNRRQYGMGIVGRFLGWVATEYPVILPAQSRRNLIFSCVWSRERRKKRRNACVPFVLFAWLFQYTCSESSTVPRVCQREIICRKINLQAFYWDDCFIIRARNTGSTFAAHCDW